MKIILTESQIKKIILKCTKLVIKEFLGAMTNHLLQLGEKIFERVHNGEYNFQINPEEFNKYQNYYKAQKPLSIKCYYNPFIDSIATLKSDDVSDYIYINLPLFNEQDVQPSVIVHELTHLVNQTMAKKSLFMPNVEDPVTHQIIYLFRETEMQARLSQFFSLLRNSPRNQIIPDIRAYEDILHSQRMKASINQCIKGNDDTTIKMLFAMNQFYKQKRKNFDGDINYDFSSFNIEQQRPKLIKYYTKKYNEFVRKATNVLALFLEK